VGLVVGFAGMLAIVIAGAATVTHPRAEAGAASTATSLFSAETRS
jgi:hypothetical protein